MSKSNLQPQAVDLRFVIDHGGNLTVLVRVGGHSQISNLGELIGHLEQLREQISSQVLPAVKGSRAGRRPCLAVHTKK